MNNTRAAIVDDDDGVLDLIELILREEGVSSKRFHQAEPLLEALHEQSFDIIISDLVLPGLSGLQLLNELNDKGIDIPFVLITGYASLDSAIESVNRGAFYYIKKPFNIEEIRFIITRLRQRQAQLEEINQLKNQVELLKAQLESGGNKPLTETLSPVILNPLQGNTDMSKAFAAIEFLGRLKSDGLLSDKEFVDFKGKILKRIA